MQINCSDCPTDPSRTAQLARPEPIVTKIGYNGPTDRASDKKLFRAKPPHTSDASDRTTPRAHTFILKNSDAQHTRHKTLCAKKERPTCPPTRKASHEAPHASAARVPSSRMAMHLLASRQNTLPHGRYYARSNRLHKSPCLGSTLVLAHPPTLCECVGLRAHHGEAARARIAIHAARVAAASGVGSSVIGFVFRSLRRKEYWSSTSPTTRRPWSTSIARGLEAPMEVAR